MQFTLIKNIRKNSSFRWMLVGLLSAEILFLPLHLLLNGLKIGWYPAQIIDTIVGNEEAFIDPLPFEELLLQAHTNLFYSVILLTLVLAIYIRTLASPAKVLPIMAILYASALFAQVALILVPWFGYVAAICWLISMWSWHLLSAWISILSLRYLLVR